MSLKDHKITTYEDSVASLPDYPSDAGYTAAQLKVIFDGRTDKEIKEKFNALIDELITRFGKVEVDIVDEVEAHNGISDAHSELFSPIHERIAEILGDIITIHTEIDGKVGVSEFDERMKPVEEKAETNFAEINVLYALLNDKVDKVAGKGLSTNDFTEEWKQSISDAFYEAIYAQQLIDEHMLARDNPHNVTVEQIGALTEEQTREIAYNTFVASEDYNGLLRDVRILQEQIGDISTALDELHAYAQALVNGGAE